jgi:hypothetical protein
MSTTTAARSSHHSVAAVDHEDSGGRFSGMITPVTCEVTVRPGIHQNV